MTLARRGTMLGLSLLACPLLASCLPAPSAWVGSGDHVAVAGDSQIYMLEHDGLSDEQRHMTNAFDSAGYRLSTSSMIGARTSDLAFFVQGSPLTAGWPDPAPQITVTALGVNDMRVSDATGQS